MVTFLIITTSIACHSSRIVQKNEEVSIRRVLAEYNLSWERHDTAIRHSLFAYDADITNVVGKTVHGREGFTEIANSPLYKIMNGEAVQKIDTVSIRFLSKTIAAVDWRWTMTGARHPDGTPWPDRRGLINLILTKENNAWLIKIFHNAEFPERSKL